LSQIVLGRLIWQRGCARVSSTGQDLAVQLEGLTRAGVEPDDIFKEKPLDLNPLKSTMKPKILTLRRRWSDRSVRTQVLVSVAAINLLAVVLATGISILNARIQTRDEIEAALEIAQHFVAATIKNIAAEDQVDRLKESLSPQLTHLRHVRIMFMDGFGNLNLLSPDNSKIAAAPSWFTTLVAPGPADRSVRVVSVPHTQPVIIAGEPANEIAEAWRDFYMQAVVWLALNSLVLVVLFLVLDRVLTPLASLSRGMRNLQGGDYTTRLPQPKIGELAIIADRFNRLAAALDASRKENRELNQQLIAVQEEERRHIANELHDEAGPCLFGISANASSIKKIAEQIKHRRSGEIFRRIGEIISIAERLKSMNRGILNRLKPESIGHVTLGELIDGLICDFQRRHPDIQINSATERLAESYGNAIDLTVYRCIQEGITNAVRHGKAEHVTIDLIEERDCGCVQAEQLRSRMCLVLRDDGLGFDRSKQKGFGLTAMTERVRALGGSCLIRSTPAEGTTIRIEIPIQGHSADGFRCGELVDDLR
jgi:two-component system, NarL family, sensor histidine kinase UhpB